MIDNDHHCLCPNCLALAKQGMFVVIHANEAGRKRLPPGVTQEEHDEALGEILALKEAAKIIRGAHPGHKPN